MQALAVRLFWFSYWLAVGLFALVAILALLLRFFLPSLAAYRSEIETLLAEQLQARVEIQALQAGWQQGYPVLQLQGLALHDLPQQPGLSVELADARFALDVATSLKVFRPVFSQIRTDGLRLQLQADTPSSQPVLPQPQQKSALPGLLTLLLHQQSVVMTDTRFEFISGDADPVTLSPLRLVLQHDGQLHQLHLRAQMVTDAGTTDLDLLAEVTGNPSRQPINLYLDLKNLNQDVLNPWLALEGIQLDSLQASQKLWGLVQAGRLEYLMGQTELSNLRYQEHQLDRLSLQTALLRRNYSYQLQLLNASVGEDQQQLNLPLISLDMVRQGVRIYPKELQLDKLELQPLQAWLLRQTFLTEHGQEILQTLNPTGELSNLQMQWPDPEQWQQFELAADLSQVGIEAWHDVPALNGIDGLLRVTPEGGEIHLKSDDFGMFFPRLYDSAWHYGQAGGVISWKLREGDVIVGSQLLHLADEHVSAAGRFSISLPYSRDEQVSLTLMIGMQQSDGAQAQYYVPPREVGEKTYAWLVRALQGGQVKQAGLVLNGNTRRRLEDFQAPSVQMFFDTQQVTFDYQPGYPPVEQSDAFLFFRNGDLLIEAAGGRLYDQKLQYANIFLPNHGSELYIRGNLSGGLGDVERLLRESPIKDAVGDGLSDWQMTGQVSSLLDLQVPVQPEGKLRVAVSGEVNRAGLRSVDSGLNLTAIEGDISYFSDSGLQSKQLRGQLFGESVRGAIATDNSGQTQISINGQATISALKSWLDLELLNLASGKLAYDAALELCPGQRCRQLTLSSDLKGISIEAPAGLGKTAADSMPFDLVSDLGSGDSPLQTLRFNLGSQFSAIMQTRDKALYKARFTLGDSSPKLPDFPGIWVDGYLPSLAYDELQRFLGQAGWQEASRSRPQSEAVLQEVALDIDRFTLGKLALDNLVARVTPNPEGWMVQADSDQLFGQLLLPTASDKPYQLQLERLTLQTGSNEQAGAEAATKPEPEWSLQPADLPLMDIRVQQLTLNDKPMGEWSLALRPKPTKLDVENIRANIRGTQLQGQMHWQQNGKALTEMVMKVNSEDFGQALSAWGYADALETQKLKGYLQLSWPGPPWDFELAGLDGQLDFTAKNGRLLDVGNSGNFLRVFGILNLSSLSRRLRLDFTDLLKKGVAFDSMDASYLIEDGIATTREPFVMKGPSANMVLTGSLDLVNETVDKDIEVALPVTGNIPLVSVLLGAPQVAGAVFLIDKLIGDPLEKFTTVRYHLKGNWNNPEAELEGLPEGKPRSPASPVLPEAGE